jgi:dTDP-4-amino-4,6-dideoxygalactose transaminase
MQKCQDITIQHLTNTADAACYAQWYCDCPNARAVADQILLLPTYPSYGERDVRRNVALVRRFFGKA